MRTPFLIGSDMRDDRHREPLFFIKFVPESLIRLSSILRIVPVFFSALLISLELLRPYLYCVNVFSLASEL